MPPRKGPQPLAALIRGAVDPLARKRGFSTADILLRWEAMAGAHLAGVTRPERVVWPHARGADGGGILHLLVRSGAVLDVGHAAPQIVERVNAALGWRAIRALKLRQSTAGWAEPRRQAGPAPLPPEQARALDQALSGIEDAGLREALRDLGAGALGDRLTTR